MVKRRSAKAKASSKKKAKQQAFRIIIPKLTFTSKPVDLRVNGTSTSPSPSDGDTSPGDVSATLAGPSPSHSSECPSLYIDLTSDEESPPPQKLAPEKAGNPDKAGPNPDTVDPARAVLDPDVEPIDLVSATYSDSHSSENADIIDVEAGGKEVTMDIDVVASDETAEGDVNIIDVENTGGKDDKVTSDETAEDAGVVVQYPPPHAPFVAFDLQQEGGEVVPAVFTNILHEGMEVDLPDLTTFHEKLGDLIQELKIRNWKKAQQLAGKMTPVCQSSLDKAKARYLEYNIPEHDCKLVKLNPADLKKICRDLQLEKMGKKNSQERPTLTPPGSTVSAPAVPPVNKILLHVWGNNYNRKIWASYNTIVQFCMQCLLSLFFYYRLSTRETSLYRR